MKKKILSVILASTMMLTAVPAFAQETTEDFDLSEILSELTDSGVEDVEEGLSSLLGLLGGAADDLKDTDLSSVLGLIGDAAEGEDFDLSSLLGGLESVVELPEMAESAVSLEDGVDLDDLNAILGALVQKSHEDGVKAESIDQFYGTWTLDKASAFGEEVPVEEVLEGKDSMTLTISENGLELDSEEDPETEMELKDGVLVVGDGNFGVVHLTEGGGICLSLGGLLDLDFVPAE